MTKQKRFGYLQIQRIHAIAVKSLRMRQKAELEAHAKAWRAEEMQLSQIVSTMGKIPYFKWPEWLKDAVHEWERQNEAAKKIFGISDEVYKNGIMGELKDVKIYRPGKALFKGVRKKPLEVNEKNTRRAISTTRRISK